MSDSGNKFAQLMENLQYECDLANENEYRKISLVYNEECKTPYVLRVCKRRNLTEVCEQLKKVKSPYTVYVYDYAYQDGDTYILEEFIDGKTLDKRIQEGELFSVEETRKIIIDVCRGLHAFHFRNPPIVHTDIKPANIMLRNDGSIKLFDFDITRTYKEGAEENTAKMLTKPYASPEHYGFGQTTPRSDIYSLGVTMHEMLSGRVLNAKRKVTYKRGLQSIIRKCVKMDPRKRYTDVDQLKKRLEEYPKRKRRIFVLGFIGIVIGIAMVLSFNILEKIEQPENYPNEPTQIQQSEKEEVVSPPSEGGTPAAEKELKLQPKLQLKGDVRSMIALNGGVIAYIEEISGEYHLKTSHQTDHILPIKAERGCRLIYDFYNDRLYVVDANLEESAIYAVNDGYLVDSQPVYQAAGAMNADITGCFFEDGTLYCDAFEKEMIAPGWSPLSGGVATKILTVIDGENYCFDILKENVDKIGVDGSRKEWFPVPGGRAKSYCLNKDAILIVGRKGEKDYIYQFDGKAYKALLCLTDVRYYLDWQYDDFCMTDEMVWLYNRESQTVVEIKIK